MAAERPDTHKKIVGDDKNYATKGFIADTRRMGVTSHVAQNTARITPSRSMPAAVSKRFLTRSSLSAWSTPCCTHCRVLCTKLTPRSH